MHHNSMTAYREDQIKLSKRSRSIFLFLFGKGPMTDREIAKAMGFPSRDAVQPRISDLINTHELLKEFDTVKCPLTGRPVRRVVRWDYKPGVQQMELGIRG